MLRPGSLHQAPAGVPCTAVPQVRERRSQAEDHAGEPGEPLHRLGCVGLLITTSSASSRSATAMSPPLTNSSRWVLMICLLSVLHFMTQSFGSGSVEPFTLYGRSRSPICDRPSGSH